MKDGVVLKTAQESTEKDLELINKLTRRPFKASEVYVFSLVLCDNDLDRDFEVFGIDCLHELKDLFLGKTGIFDHDPKGMNQTARIFCTEVVKDEARKTQTGDDYYMLKGKAYMIRSEKNKDLIEEIDGGIKKEVSIGCSVSEVRCSVCGCNVKEQRCEHQPGQSYFVDGNKTLCYRILKKANDAYEWSFVAVPAQRRAGVVKSVQKSQAGVGTSYVAQLEETVREFKEELKEQVRKQFVLQHPELKVDVIKSMVEGLGIAELREIKKSQEKGTGMGVVLQTESRHSTEKEDISNFLV